MRDPVRRRDLLPREFCDLDQFVVWTYEARGDGKKPKKVPYQPSQPHTRASTVDPATWSSFDVAVGQVGAFDGLGFVFSPDDPYAGVDIDACVLRGGRLHPAAAAIVEQLDSYTEVSPSGMGVKVIVKAELFPGRHSTRRTPWGDELAVYDRGRFFTVTGRAIAHPGVIHERQQELDAIIARVFPSAPPPRPGVHLQPAGDVQLRLQQALKRSALFSALHAGDISGYDNDDSRGDLAYAKLAAWWTGGDPDQIEWMMRRSALARPKWDRPWGETTYLRRTIEKALDT
jgi:putative DNA primase/helicase